MTGHDSQTWALLVEEVTERTNAGAGYLLVN